ncbi:GNAT family N-acetyltransferase [Bacillus suaedaesalsae]|uniref:GNAT family N-acetyltransferase n=1 Tax=Bacillus suaedaesalsae TaxID=2810349 RepID=A0ABS2DNF5_9BACI|nr:GNAT family N-acetyltransferase [Bacillus suaedaesalsae]
MYQYFHGLIIREGTHGIPADKVKKLFEDAGWMRINPEWQDEKYQLIFENSTCAYTVWDGEEMIGMIRVISDQITIATIADLVVRSTHRGQGIAKKLIELCVSKLPHGDWFANTSSNNFSFYEKCGFEVKDLSENGTCVLYGFRKARQEGHR